MIYKTAYIACIENKDGSRFPNGRLYLYSAPHRTHKQAQDWADAFEGATLLRIEPNQVPVERIVQ